MKTIVRKTALAIQMAMMLMVAGVGTQIAVPIFNTAVLAQNTPTISDLNDEVEDQYDDVKDLVETILNILILIAFVLMVSAIVMKSERMQQSIIGFIIVLVLRGIFLIF
jgi:uncharacterized membrane protein (DUF373 family)